MCVCMWALDTRCYLPFGSRVQGRLLTPFAPDMKHPPEGRELPNDGSSGKARSAIQAWAIYKVFRKLLPFCVLSPQPPQDSPVLTVSTSQWFSVASGVCTPPRKSGAGGVKGQVTL